jgi:hypothetical protein
VSETPAPAPAPAILGAVVVPLREALVERGLWRDVLGRAREDHALADASALEQAVHSSWVPLDTYASMVDAVGDILGEDGVRDLGEGGLDGELEDGFYSTMLRSWVQSLSAEPEEVVRAGPHLWRAALRNAGTMQLAASGNGFTRLRIQMPPPQLLASRAWQVLLEGIGRALLDHLGLHGDVHCAPASGESRALDYLLMWDS